MISNNKAFSEKTVDGEANQREGRQREDTHKDFKTLYILSNKVSVVAVIRSISLHNKSQSTFPFGMLVCANLFLLLHNY